MCERAAASSHATSLLTLASVHRPRLVWLIAATGVTDRGDDTNSDLHLLLTVRLTTVRKVAATFLVPLTGPLKRWLSLGRDNNGPFPRPPAPESNGGETCSAKVEANSHYKPSRRICSSC